MSREYGRTAGDNNPSRYKMGQNNLDKWDIVAIFGYFLAVVLVSVMAMFRSNRGTKEGFFLAGRFMTWLPVGASLYASNIGSEHFIGLAGSGAASGIGVGAFELNACILLQLLGFIFLPVYIASKVCTLPEYMNKRFGGTRIQIYLATLSLILYVFTKISVNLYSGALFIQVAVGWNIWTSIIPLLLITTFITVTGGLAAVIYTDTLQCFLMIIGGSIVMFSAFYQVGGISGLYDQYFTSFSHAALTATNGTNVCNQPSEKAFVMLRGLGDPDMPWLGFLLGQTPASIWYWCTDQMMVQRTLASKSLSHAQGATLFAGVLKFSPLFMLVMPGMISRVLYPEEVACATRDECMMACGSPISCSNIAYPKLVMELMPSGLRGVMLAVMLAALMSDLTSIFNSASTLFTIDIYGKLKYILCDSNKSKDDQLVIKDNDAEVESTQIDRKDKVDNQIVSSSQKATKQAKTADMSNLEMMIVGRLFILVMVLISVAWVPMIQNMQGGQLYIYIQSMAADLSPPVAAVYLVAVFWQRANEKGAFCGLLVGFITGCIRMILDMIYRSPHCGEEDTRPLIVAKFHYMYFAVLLFFLTILVIVVVSLCTQPAPSYKTIRTTYWTRFDVSVRPDEEQQHCTGEGRRRAAKTKDDNEKHIMVNEIELSRRGSSSTDGIEATEVDFSQTTYVVSNNRNSTSDERNASTSKHEHTTKLDWSKWICMWLLGLNSDEESDDLEEINKEEFRQKDRSHISSGSGNSNQQQLNGTNMAPPKGGALIDMDYRSIKQDPRTKILLYILLILVVGLAIFLYLYFSIGTRYLYPYPPHLSNSSSDHSSMYNSTNSPS